LNGPHLGKLRRCHIDAFVLQTVGLKLLRLPPILLLFLTAFANRHYAVPDQVTVVGIHEIKQITFR